MEVGVRLLGIVLRLLNFLLAPLFWFRTRNRRAVPRPPHPLLLRSAKEHATAIRSGEITSEELVIAYINRVQEVNPLLNAVVEERYRAALEDAKEVDRCLNEAIRTGTLEELVAAKPLLGVPFTVKESCSLAGLSNAVGCLEYAGRKATEDGGAVRLVKEAGGIPLLVSNTPELCLGWETTNLLKGTTNNPYCLSRTPGGSSGGEGALLACGASAVSVASDIAGSIRVPAAFCGVFGHKPTPGIIPIDGHIPTLSDPKFPNFLTVGPMARRAEDLPLLMNIMAGDNRHMLNLDEPVDLSTLQVYYMTEAAKSLALLNVDKCIKDKIKRAVKYLRTECGSKICKEKFKDLEDSVEMSVSVFFSMKDIPNMLQDPNDPKLNKSLFVELVKTMFGGAARSLQGLGFTVIARNNLFIPAARREHYEEKAARLKEQLIETLGDNGVLLYPVFPGAAHAHGRVFVRAAGVLYSMLFNVLGCPATAVPVGTAGHLPVAIQVIAAPNQDRLCLAVAKQLEIGFGGWCPPQ
ncbi:fatty-acid amide hydrolase 2-A isoform X3 [Ostrinia furnacalis]|uniref:fatty-acid amide hydrolase 2-A isoform X3 n=1 Tax=Ostrinia furnacalis TaxID=93504 RepID=UPI00103B7618|nr:fatty-acid amide hydrolase 2-A isoform X3 [Ostrinia furnacalis]XP_028163364.1 fatty-acid amide hydrolase 2-A isoform X3 [Ostrinia furnacalis]XP_028163365.1 fatty-acid amide hydrolase 2-A isoform X3 [Ostrinia furnacalis]XP_028163366.1 fatty-acid amide hydrolase 2-A isoform X3 [Ostrinia furnacalis]